MMEILLAYIGMAIMVVLSGVGSAYGVSMCGCTAVGALKKNPGGIGSYLMLSALPSTQGLYGFAGFFIMQSRLTADITPLTSAAIFAAGLILGIVGLLSAIRQAKVCASGIEAVGNGYNVAGNTMVLAVFAELYAIIGLLAVFIINTAL